MSIATTCIHRYSDGITPDWRDRVLVPEMPATWGFATKNHGERPHGASPG